MESQPVVVQYAEAVARLEDLRVRRDAFRKELEDRMWLRSQGIDVAPE